MEYVNVTWKDLKGLNYKNWMKNAGLGVLVARRASQFTEA